MGSAAKKGYQSTQSASSDSSDSNSSSSSSSSGSSSGMTRPVAKKKPGLLSRIGSKLKSGLKKAVGKTARAVSRGTRNVARRMGEEVEPEEKKKEGPNAKEKQMLSHKKQMINKTMMLQKKKLMLQKQGKLPMGGMNEDTILEKDMIDKEGNDKFDRHKRMIRHKQDKHGRASVMDKIKTGKDYKEETINERGDYWHPDPEQDRKLGGPGPNARAREDRADAAKPKEDPKKLRKGESYFDYNKRQKASKMRKEELSVKDQMKISREAAKNRNPNPDHRKINAMKASNQKKDNRTDSQKMADAYASPRKGPGGATKAD